MKEVIIELDDMYSEVLSITAIGKHGNTTNISTQAVELSKGAVLEFDGEKWTQRKSKHTGVVLEDEDKEVASDLISRSALIDRFNDTGIQIAFDLPVEEKLGEDVDLEAFAELVQDAVQSYKKMVIDVIQNQPTAYDVDAVVEELEQQAEQYRQRGFEAEAKGYSAMADKCYGKYCSYEHATEIVRKGGV